MNSVKLDIMRAALERIANEAALPAAEMPNIARLALADVAAIVDYQITARTWWGRGGCEFKAEIRVVSSGYMLTQVTGTGSGWDYALRDAMARQFPEKFPAHNGTHPTIYFRDVCRVPYEHMEVERKRDL